MLVNGILSAGYDFIFPTVDVLPDGSMGNYATSPSHIGVPYFFGAGRMLAFAVDENSGFHILRKIGAAGPFTKLGGLLYKPDSQEPFRGKARYTNYFNPEGTQVVVALRKGHGAEERTYLSRAGELHGPYDDARIEKDYFNSKRDMSLNGENWVMLGTNALYTRQEKIPIDSPRTPKISADGTSLAYNYSQDQKSYLVVDGETYGPYEVIGDFLYLRQTPHWICSVINTEGERYLLSGDGQQRGPYTNVFYQRYKQGWYSMFSTGNAMYLSAEGETIAGPFEQSTAAYAGSNQVLPERWMLTARKGEYYSVYLNGELAGEYGPYNLISPPVVEYNQAGDAWSLKLKRGEIHHIIVNGEIRARLASPYAYNDIKTSPNMQTHFITGLSQTGEYFLLTEQEELGPYYFLEEPVFSAGEKWSLKALHADGTHSLLTQDGREEAFARILAHGFVEESKAYLLYKNGAGESYVRWREGQYGPYDKAGVQALDQGGLALGVYSRQEGQLQFYRLH